MRRLVALAAAGLLLAGCAAIEAPRIRPGVPAEEVRAKLGAPTDERRLADGTRAWDYVFGPFGFDTWRYTFDAAGRVTRAEQLLTEARFRRITAGETTRDGVADLIGRPMETMVFPRSHTEVWTYRWRDGSIDMLNDVVFSTDTQKVLYYALYMDPRVTNSVDH